MSIDLTKSAAPDDPGGRCPSPEDAEALARLMLGAYRGSADDQGETLDDARGEVHRLLDGAYGPLLAAASDVVERDGELVAATLVTRWQGSPLVAFTMTAPDWKRRGLARASIRRCMRSLMALGEHRLSLVVTRGNVPAERLYESMGFEECRS